MSQNALPPSDSPSPQERADLTDQQLADQARAAADQALQLARLAEQSARLAQQLNEQVLTRSGHSPKQQTPGEAPHGGSQSLETGAAEQPFAVRTDDPSSSRSIRRRGRRRRARRLSLREQLMRGSRSAPEDPPERVAIQTTPSPRISQSDDSWDVARNWKSLLLSSSLHVLVLVLLGFFTFVVEPARPIDTILASFVDVSRDVQEAVPVEAPTEEESTPAEDPPTAPDAPPDPPPDAETPPEEREPIDPAPELDAPKTAQPAPNPASEDPAPSVDLAKVGSRSQAGKELLLKKYGGTAESESAVSRALDWFVSIQRRDGSWNFNDVGRSSQAGTVNNPMGGTSFVLLAFLGTGQTHFEGKYKQSVAHGLRFLLQNARAVPAGADFRGPNVEENHNFYVQGAAATALCEAYAMTKDRKLRKPAEAAMQFIIAAQDPRGGGWRYAPREPGCTSVTTLQLAALVGAQRCGLTVPPRTLDGVRHYYTTVKCDQEPTGRYAYRAEGLSYRASSTAQAALGMMYLGVPRDDEDLQAAVALLDAKGPYENRYYCYYAAQVLKNWGGREWERWNESLREELLLTQDATDGPARGSWAPTQRGPTDVSGGRLFTTVLSTLTLEVYYRYLPIYGWDGDEAGTDGPMPAATDDDVPAATPPNS